MENNPYRENIGFPRCGGEREFQDENPPEAILTARFGSV